MYYLLPYCFFLLIYKVLHQFLFFKGQIRTKYFPQNFPFKMNSLCSICFPIIHVSHAYVTICFLIVLYDLNLVFLDSSLLVNRLVSSLQMSDKGTTIFVINCCFLPNVVLSRYFWHEAVKHVSLNNHIQHYLFNNTFITILFLNVRHLTLKQLRYKTINYPIQQPILRIIKFNRRCVVNSQSLFFSINTRKIPIF